MKLTRMVGYQLRVLRLFEEEKIDIKTAKKLLKEDEAEISRQIEFYYNRLAAFLKNQTKYKVLSSSGHHRIGVPVAQVLDDIYDGKFQLLKKGVIPDIWKNSGNNFFKILQRWAKLK